MFKVVATAAGMPAEFVRRHRRARLPNIDHARKIGQHSVPGVLHDPAPVFLDLRINSLTEMRLQAFVRALLIGAHEPRITGHISG
jgi:hypothetical protein